MSKLGLMPGDIVTLKSGGPPMTVDSLFESETGVQSAICQWFGEWLNGADPEPHMAGFSCAALDCYPPVDYPDAVANPA